MLRGSEPAITLTPRRHDAAGAKPIDEILKPTGAVPRRTTAHIEERRAAAREYGRSKRGRELNKIAVAKWQAANPEKVAAQRAVQAAIQRGDLSRPGTCEAVGCAQPARHAHHGNYSKPLAVAFLCPGHHEAVHHRGAQKLKAGLERRFARPPKTSSTFH
jgi:hypothetical protein